MVARGDATVWHSMRQPRTRLWTTCGRWFSTMRAGGIHTAKGRRLSDDIDFLQQSWRAAAAAGGRRARVIPQVWLIGDTGGGGNPFIVCGISLRFIFTTLQHRLYDEGAVGESARGRRWGSVHRVRNLIAVRFTTSTTAGNPLIAPATMGDQGVPRVVGSSGLGRSSPDLHRLYPRTIHTA